MATETKLSDKKIRGAKPKSKPYKLTDGAGLSLQVNPNGSKLWRLRYRIGGKENVFALGCYVKKPTGETDEAKKLRHAAREFTLEEARLERIEAKRLVKKGVHPSHQRKEEKRQKVVDRATTFEGVAAKWLVKQVSWKPNTKRQRENALATHVYPVMGARPINEITRPEINDLLEGISAPRMAILVRQMIRLIFNYAEDKGYIENSVATRLVSIDTPDTENSRKLSVSDIGGFLRACDKYKGSYEVRTAMSLAWLTLGRTMEVLGAEWSEIDFDAALWRIPGARMKKKEDHIIPLSSQALELLRGLQAVTGKGVYLFPNRSDRHRHVSNGVLWKMVESIGYKDKFSPHGLRGSASTILNESRRWDGDVIEKLLSHSAKDKVRASYNAAEYLGERAEALQFWSDQLDQLKADKKGAEILHLGKRLRAV